MSDIMELLAKIAELWRRIRKAERRRDTMDMPSGSLSSLGSERVQTSSLGDPMRVVDMRIDQEGYIGELLDELRIDQEGYIGELLDELAPLLDEVRPQFDVLHGVFKDVMELYYLKGRTWQEIGGIVGYSPQWVFWARNKAMGELRQQKK